ncbi:adenosylhomocysteinase [Coprothermobacter platensis]|uniref:adenosylhomocysteinase n=1 Tax=Coprothermobacter platensis TaxID=108819 RepID=UPI0003682543|nr:adenosylhomocysteinase [Coprothermobacter platensis]
MSEVRRPELFNEGLIKIEWVKKFMPVCDELEKRYAESKPFSGTTIAMCIHLEAKTARLALLLKKAGAEVIVTGSNPLSTQDDVAAALAHEGLQVFAWRGESQEEYEHNLERLLSFNPDLILDDGFDLTTMLVQRFPEQARNVIGGTEETTTGVIRARNMAKAGVLPFPVVAVNDARIKHLFDNRYGTGESSVYSFMHNTNLLVGGKTFVVAGFGFVGRGIAEKLRGLGANVIVTEVDPIKALEAHAEGFTVMNMDKACERGEVFITATGDIHVIRKEHFLKMRDGAILGNAGHFNVEVDVDALEKMAEESYEARPNITGYKLPNGKVLFLLAEGRLMNLAAGQGHPAEIMDLSFAAQFLSLKYLLEQKGKLNAEVLMVPTIIDEDIAFTKLSSLGINIDTLTEEQKEYLSRW